MQLGSVALGHEHDPFMSNKRAGGGCHCNIPVSYIEDNLILMNLTTFPSIFSFHSDIIHTSLQLGGEGGGVVVLAV